MNWKMIGIVSGIILGMVAIGVGLIAWIPAIAIPAIVGFVVGGLAGGIGVTYYNSIKN